MPTFSEIATELDKAIKNVEATKKIADLASKASTDASNKYNDAVNHARQVKGLMDDELAKLGVSGTERIRRSA